MHVKKIYDIGTRWDFIEKLHEVQEQAGLRAGNKLRKAHIEFRKMKMKVSLAAQTLRFIEISRNFTLTDSTRMILDQFHDTSKTVFRS
jgi:hypothetical protein